MDLINLYTNEVIREATEEEERRSDDAAERDGGVGAIEVDGVTCYVGT